MPTHIHYAGTTWKVEDPTVLDRLLEETQSALADGVTRLVRISGGPNGETWHVTVGAGIPLIVIEVPEGTGVGVW